MKLLALVERLDVRGTVLTNYFKAAARLLMAVKPLRRLFLFTEECYTCIFRRLLAHLQNEIF